MSDGSVATSTAIDGAWVFTPRRHEDERGWFVRTLELDWCAELGLETSFVHHNQSRSRTGVLRGLHVRTGASEAKLVRCASGAVVDFAVDVRPWSSTFRAVERLELDDLANRHLYLPPGVAHGFQVVSAVADVCYLHTRQYEPGADVSIAWDDPTLGIDWPLRDPVLSQRDRDAPSLADLDLESLFAALGGC